MAEAHERDLRLGPLGPGDFEEFRSLFRQALPAEPGEIAARLGFMIMRRRLREAEPG